MKTMNADNFIRRFASLALLCLVAMGLAGPRSTRPAWAQEGASERQAYLVEVPLPLIGDRDESVRRQISQIASVGARLKERPVVILSFKATATTELPKAENANPGDAGLESRGSEFERCLALARSLTSDSAARVRLVAYLPSSVEGHAVLPVLACEEILASPSAELGRASLDDAKVEEGVKGFYRDVVSRRRTLPMAVVMSNADSWGRGLQSEDGGPG